MRRISDIGAAVIGTGFIGTVHLEALRRIGVTGPRRPRQHRPSEGKPAPRHSASASRTRRSMTSSPTDTVDVVHVTSPNDVHVQQSLAILRAGKHVVCEKPLAMTADESAGLVAAAATSGLVNATNFNIRYYPLNQHARELVAGGGLGEVRLVTGRYFQDWLLHDTDWNWRLAARPGRSAPRRRRHRVALARPDGVRDRPARRLGHGGPRRRSSRPATNRPDRSSRSRPNGRRTPSPARWATEDTASILLRFDDGARGAVTVSQISAGRKNSLQWEIDGSDRARRGTPRQPDHLWLGHRDAAERDPPPEPGADGRGRPGGGGPARRPRRGLRRHVRRPLPGDLRRRPGRPPVVQPAATPTSPTGTTRCSSTTRSRESAEARSLGRCRSAASRRDPDRRHPATHAPTRSCWRRTSDEARAAHRAVPGDAARRTSSTGRPPTASRPSRSPAGRARPADAAATPARRTSTSRTSRPSEATRPRAPRSRRRASSSPGSATTRTRSIPTRSTGPTVIGHLKHVITAAEKMDVPLVNTFMGGDRRQDPGRELGRGAPGLAGHRRRSPTTTAGRSRSRTARCSSATTSGPAATTSRRSPRIWRRILEQWGGTIGLNFDPSHLVLQMIDIPRFIREFGPHILHVQAKDLVDRPRGPVRARRLLDGDRLADPAAAGARRRRLGPTCSARSGGSAMTAT